MFHWICPECGQEIAPNLRQCPACEPAPEPPPPPEASAVAVAPHFTPLAPEPAEPQGELVPVGPPPLPPEFRAAGTRPAEAAPPPLPIVPLAYLAPATCPPAPPQSVAEPLVFETERPAPPPVEQVPLPFVFEREAPREPEPELEPLLALAESVREQQEHEPQADLLPLAVAVGAAPQPEPQAEPEPHVEPHPEPNAEPELVAVAAAAVATAPRVETELLPTAEYRIPIETVYELEPLHPDPAAKVEEPEAVAPAPLAASLGTIAAPHAAAPASHVAGTIAAASSVFTAPRPPALARSSPAPLPGDYLNCAIPLLSKMRPAAPKRVILAPDTGHRLTLPGPKLTKDLESLGAAGLRTNFPYSPPRPRTGMSGWAISFAVMMLLLFMGGAAIYTFAPKASAETKSTSQEAAATVPDPTHPLGKFVEVTGIRIIVDYNKKSEIHYLLVNHSATELNDVSVQVTLINRSAKPGQPPVAKFVARINGLGPFESKEMVSAIEKPNRAVPLPEWQDLRAEAQVDQ